MKYLLKIINKFFYNIFYYFIIFYQKIISPILPARCRYYPTCSNYGKQALAWHGVWSGSWLLLKRISSCHPLGGHGVDFVPLPLSSYYYQYLPPIALASVKAQGLCVFRDTTSYVSRLNQLMKLTWVLLRTGQLWISMELPTSYPHSWYHLGWFFSKMMNILCDWLLILPLRTGVDTVWWSWHMPDFSFPNFLI